MPSSIWDSVNAELADIDWSWHLRARNVKDALSHFPSFLNSALERHFWPFSKQPYSHRCPRPNQPPWVDAHLRTAIKWKYDLYSIFKKYPTKRSKQAYQQQRNLVKTLTRTKYRAYIRSMETTLQGRHHPSLHQFVRQARIRNASQEIPSLTTRTQQVTDPLAKSTALNAQFASMTRPDDPSLSIPAILTPQSHRLVPRLPSPQLPLSGVI